MLTERGIWVVGGLQLLLTAIYGALRAVGW